MVYEVVIPESEDYFTADQQEAIYTDKYFGLNSVRKLITWVIAADEVDTGREILTNSTYSMLLDYFKDQSMTEAKMNLIVG
jgi:hypothetical protein